MIDIKKLAAFMSSKEIFSWVNAAPNETEKRKRIDEAKKKFLSGNFSSVANFAAACDEIGNPDAIYDADWDFATFNQKAKEHTAFNDIKRLTLAHSVKDSIKQYLLQRNSVIKANKEKAKLKEKEKENNNVSRPFWY